MGGFLLGGTIADCGDLLSECRWSLKRQEKQKGLAEGFVIDIRRNKPCHATL